MVGIPRRDHCKLHTKNDAGAICAGSMLSEVFKMEAVAHLSAVGGLFVKPPD